MTFKHNPKDIAITAPEFIHCLLEPKATLPCGGMDPDFDWFDEPEAHINAGHFRLEEELKDLREWKKKSLIRAFTRNLVWEESEFWTGQFIKDLIGEDGIGISYAAKERLLAHAFAHQTVSDLEMVNVTSRHAVAESKEVHSMVEGLASPKVIQNHMQSLLFYIRSIYPLPTERKERGVFLEGTDGSITTRRSIQYQHERIRTTLRPIIEELTLFLPVQSVTWHDLEMQKYPMDREADYTYWMWHDRFWTP